MNASTVDAAEYCIHRNIVGERIFRNIIYVFADLFLIRINF